MKPRGILEAALYCPDLDQAEAFYGGILGLEQIAKQPGRHVFFRCGEAVLLLFDPASTMVRETQIDGTAIPLHGARGAGHLAFRATETEIDEWKQRLADAAVAIDSEVRWPTGGRSIYFRDPAGNVLEFANPSLWSLTTD